jgi:outer membrane protein TolC
MKKLLIIILILNSQLSVLHSQRLDTLSLKYCYKLAVDNYPLVKQRELLPQSSKLKTDNYHSGYYPQLMLNAQASYQSQVTELPISLPFITIPSLAKDQYRANLDVNELIYDGGITHRQVKLEESNLQFDRQNLEVMLYQLKQRVNQLFFSLLILNENLKVLEVQQGDLKVNLNKINTGIKFGTAFKANADQISAEIIKLDEQIVDINHTIYSTRNMLTELIGKEINDNTKLILPEVSDVLGDKENKRPEMNLYDLQQNILDANKNLISSQRYPRISAFGEAGYGRPGFNMLSNQFNTYWMLGGKISWNIWDWNQTGKQKKIFDLQKEIVSTQKQTFDKNIKVSLNTYIADINKYTELIKKDDDVLKLRESIMKSASSQLENGVITSTDFIIQENDLTMAKLSLQNHRLLLIYAKINYLTELGK